MNSTTNRTEVKFFYAGNCPAKASYAHEAYEILYSAYKGIGGIDKGRGFKSSQDMLKNIPVWRLVFKNGRMASVMMFKKSDAGLKMVAYAPKCKEDKDLVKSDVNFMLEHSYAELSDALLVTAIKALGNSLHDYLFNPKTVMAARKISAIAEYGIDKIQNSSSARIFEKIKKEFPELLRYCYVRKIGGTYKMKMAMGCCYL